MRHGALLTVALACGFAPSLQAADALVVELRDSVGNPVADAAVLLRDGAPAVAVNGATIDQVDRQFSPPASIVPVGTAVSFPNRDDIRHHVYSFSRAKTFELKLYSGTPAAPVLFDQPGIVVLGCNIHDGMLAFVYVVDVAHAALSDATGLARLTPPAGAASLEIWHPQLRAPLHLELPAAPRAALLQATLALDDASVAPPPLD